MASFSCGPPSQIFAVSVALNLHLHTQMMNGYSALWLDELLRFIVCYWIDISNNCIYLRVGIDGCIHVYETCLQS